MLRSSRDKSSVRRQIAGAGQGYWVMQNSQIVVHGRRGMPEAIDGQPLGQLSTWPAGRRPRGEDIKKSCPPPMNSVRRSPRSPVAAHRAREVAIAVGLCLLVSGNPHSGFAQAAQDYQLGVNDRLAIKVGRWKAVEATFEGWEGLSGEYRVGPNGKISIALAGDIPAAGRTAEQISRELALRIQRRIGLDQPPATAVEVAEFRPIYVVGAVNTPGEFRYRPGMTVIQAVGLAGGIYRPQETMLNAERERLIAVRDYDLVRAQRWSLLARKARLEAQLAESKEVTITEEFKRTPNADRLVKMENEILIAELNTLKSKLAALTDLSKLLRSKLEKLAEEIEIRAKQLKRAKERLDGVRSLVERGLTTKSRLTDLSQAVTDLEATQIALEVLNLTTAQDLNQTLREKVDLVNTARQDVLNKLRNTEAELDQVELNEKAAAALVSQTSSLGAGLRTDLNKPNSEPKLIYVLSRRGGGELKTLTVTEHATVQPGDTLQVSAATPSEVSAATP